MARGPGCPGNTGRGRRRHQPSLLGGINPIGWLADVQHLPSGESQSHGSSPGATLRHFCNGGVSRGDIELSTTSRAACRMGTRRGSTSGGDSQRMGMSIAKLIARPPNARVAGVTSPAYGQLAARHVA